METHISWVLLVGDRAYKVKKPVDFGFVDFTSLKKRRFFCEEELRLNRRLAPDLYLGLHTITAGPTGPAVDGKGDPIEVVLEMQRFDQSELLINAERAGKLTTGHMDELAETIAEFHRRSPAASPADPYGSPALIARSSEENFHHLLQGIPQGGKNKLLDRLHSWTSRQHQRLNETFIARKAEGRIRECHGDLHLGNMILRDESITPFDCIEFNPELRWIDVLSDVAFCTMDLRSRGRDRLAHHFLNAYLEITGDYEGFAVLPYYLSYRAMVRAKIASLNAQEGSKNKDDKQHGEECSRYLSLAEKFVFGRKPGLIVMHGVSGTGKSFGSAEILREIGAVRVRSDVERKRIAAGAGAGDLYTEEMTGRTYERLFQSADRGLESGFTVILDAAFLRERERAAALALARRRKVPCRILNLTAPEEMLKRRLDERQERRADPSDANREVLREQIRSREPITETEREIALEVDAGQPDCWDRIARILQDETDRRRR